MTTCLLIIPATSSSQNQCKNNGQVYAPNISDLYFNHTNVANLINDQTQSDDLANLTTVTVGNESAYNFTVSFESALYCSGIVESIQYCYQAKNNMSMGRVIDILYRVEDTQNRNITTMQSTQQSAGCSLVNNTHLICCDKVELNSDHFQITSMNYTLNFSVVVRNPNVQLLTLVGTIKGMYYISSSVLLLRFLIKLDIPTGNFHKLYNACSLRFISLPPPSLFPSRAPSFPPSFPPSLLPSLPPSLSPSLPPSLFPSLPPSLPSRPSP